MGPLGFPELLFILVLALLIFGPRRIPEIGRTLGKAMGEFRRATTDFKRTLNVEAGLDKPPAPNPPIPKPPTPKPPTGPDAIAPPREASPAEVEEPKEAAGEEDTGSDAESVPRPAGTEPRD